MKLLILVNLQNGFIESQADEYECLRISKMVHDFTDVIDLRSTSEGLSISPYSIEWNLERNIQVAITEKFGLVPAQNPKYTLMDFKSISELVTGVGLKVGKSDPGLNLSSVTVFGLHPVAAKIAIVIKALYPRLHVATNLDLNAFDQLSLELGKI